MQRSWGKTYFTYLLRGWIVIVNISFITCHCIYCLLQVLSYEKLWYKACKYAAIFFISCTLHVLVSLLLTLYDPIILRRFCRIWGLIRHFYNGCTLIVTLADHSQCQAADDFHNAILCTDSQRNTAYFNPPTVQIRSLCK